MRHATANTTSGCDLCDEIASDAPCTFRTIYRNEIQDRILVRSGGFVLMPAIGQIVPDSFLLLPEQHVHRMADLRPSDLRVANEILRRIEGTLGIPLLFFEHGARPATDGGCGIYHAHIHVMPWRRAIDPADLLEGGIPARRPFIEHIEDLRNEPEYIVAGASGRPVKSVSIRTANRAGYGSQYLRRRIAQAVGTPKAWDWRSYTAPEPRLSGALLSWRPVAECLAAGAHGESAEPESTEARA